jgi:hypothetical protein
MRRPCSSRTREEGDDDAAVRGRDVGERGEDSGPAARKKGKPTWALGLLAQDEEMRPAGERNERARMEKGAQKERKTFFFYLNNFSKCIFKLTLNPIQPNQNQINTTRIMLRHECINMLLPHDKFYFHENYLFYYVLCTNQKHN